jgi:hypothetical protein
MIGRTAIPSEVVVGLLVETGDLAETEVDWLVDTIEVVMLLRAVDEECVVGIIVVGIIPGSVPI